MTIVCQPEVIFFVRATKNDAGILDVFQEVFGCYDGKYAIR